MKIKGSGDREQLAQGREDLVKRARCGQEEFIKLAQQRLAHAERLRKIAAHASLSNVLSLFDAFPLRNSDTLDYRLRADWKGVESNRKHQWTLKRTIELLEKNGYFLTRSLDLLGQTKASEEQLLRSPRQPCRVLIPFPASW